MDATAWDAFGDGRSESKLGTNESWLLPWEKKQLRAALRRLGHTTYEDYTWSTHWREFKIAYRGSDEGLLCFVCAGKPHVVHHHTYEQLGAELASGVCSLCRPCHERVHLIHVRRFVPLAASALTARREHPRSLPFRGSLPPELVAEPMGSSSSS
jgi:hypothetical protein